MGCPPTSERKQKNNSNFHFQVSAFAYDLESVRLQECVNTEFDREVKREFEKASLNRAVHLRECPLAES